MLSLRCDACCARLVVGTGGWQERCRGRNCNKWTVKNKHHLCRQCDHDRRYATPTRPHISVEQQVARNVTDMMALLPPHSHHRAPLVHFLSRGLDSTAAAHSLGCSSSYVRQCKRKQYSESDLLQEKYLHDVKRQKLAPPVLQSVFEYLIGACPTKSGERATTLHQFVSDSALYAGYCKLAANPISFHTFYNIKRWMRVKRTGTYFGLFDCAKCYSLKQLPALIAAEPDYANRTRMQLELQECEKHQQRNFSQRQQYINTRAQLSKNESRLLLVLMDFTSTSLAAKAGVNTYLQDLIVVMEWKDRDGHLQRANLDYLCEDISNKHDYFFVLNVWLKMFSDFQFNSNFDAIQVWSDGGPHHFKTRFCQFMWRMLSTMRFSNKRIEHHFFVSYHGHSLADGHAAVVKRALLARYKQSELARMVSTGSQPDVGPQTSSDLVELLKTWANTQPYLLPCIYRDPWLKPKVRHIPSIKTMHALRYEGGKNWRAESSADPQWQQFFFGPITWRFKFV
jgi:hypothetical protein